MKEKAPQHHIELKSLFIIVVFYPKIRTSLKDRQVSVKARPCLLSG